MKLTLSVTVAVAATLIASPVIQAAPGLESLKDATLYQLARTPLHLLSIQDSHWLPQGSVSPTFAFGSTGQHGFVAAQKAGQLIASFQAGLQLHDEARLQQGVPMPCSAVFEAAHCGSAWSSSTATEELSNTPSRECTGSQQSTDHAPHKLLQLQASYSALRQRYKSATPAKQRISARRKARRRHQRTTKADVKASAAESHSLERLILTTSKAYAL